MLFSVDVGYGMVKAISEAGNKVSFPSVVATRTSSLAFDLLGEVISKNEYAVIFQDPDTNQEGEYLVGDAALNTGGVRAWEEDFSVNRNFKILVALACNLLEPSRDSLEVDLQVGLPLAYYTPEYRNNLVEAVNGTELFLEREDADGPSHITINSLRVNPQAVGVFYGTLLEENGKVKNQDLAEKPSGVIDIGYRTTEIIAMSRGKNGLVPRDDMAEGFELGVNRAYRMLKSEFDAKEGSNIPLEWIEQAMLWNDGMLDYRGEQFNLKPLSQKVFKEVAEEVAAGIKQKWGQELDRLAVIQLAGGGGAAVFPYLKEELPNVSLVEDPYFANASGFLLAALHQKGERKGEEKKQEERQVQGEREEVKGYREEMNRGEEDNPETEKEGEEE